MKNFKITQSITNRQDESLKLYFRDIAKQPLIDVEEEVELAQRIKKGDKKALDKLINANLRFVVSVAKQYQNKGIPLVDLIQAGNLGLIECVKKWDETKGFKFISYAVWWIRQSIMQMLSLERKTIRVPMSQLICINKINSIITKFEQEYGRKPSTEELEEYTNLSSDKISFALTSTNKYVSLETPFNNDDAGCLLDVIPDNNCENTDSNLIQSSISQNIENVLNKLSCRERDIIRMSFGIGMPAMQNEEIANRFGIGCERVRQIQNNTISKIRSKYKEELKKAL